MEAEVREEVTRDFNIEYHLKRYGHPAAMLDTVKTKLDDGTGVTSVWDALVAIGFDEQSMVDRLSPEVYGDAETTPATPVPEPSSTLGAEIAALAAGQKNPDVNVRIDQAETPEELEEVMRDAGLKTDAY